MTSYTIRDAATGRPAAATGSSPVAASQTRTDPALEEHRNRIRR